ncbi:M50 family metallopeptidase [Candidatus Woesearchaeota archaeon]|nr:M50 family metallopeptidase [Candidatus Woesearchaeota archaeon]
MVLFSLLELLDIIIMTAAVGFIFKDSFVVPRRSYNPLLHARSFFDIESFRLAIIATAPAIVLHEMAHKFVALAAGIPAVFHADYFWLSLGVIIKLLNFPFVFFVPGFVETVGGTPLERALIAFSGPFMNLILWLGSEALIRSGKAKGNYLPIAYATKQINMFLFIFNMLPIPFLTDGWHFFSSVIEMF